MTTSPFQKLLMLSLFLVFGLGQKVHAQVTPFTNFYQQNWQMVNPAAIDRWQIFKRSNNSSMLVSTGFRGQWLLGGVEGAPKTAFVSFENAPNVNVSASGIKYGFTAFNDNASAFSNRGAFFNISYYTAFSNREVIHFGISGGAAQQVIDRDKLRPASSQDNLINGIDDGKLYPDFSLGVFYRRKLSDWGDRLYAGLSIPKVINREAKSLAILDKGTPLYFLLGAFILGQDGGFFDGLTYEPSIWVRHAKGIGFYSLSTKKWQYLSVDASMRVYFDEKFWLGVGYGTYQSGMAEAGFLLETEEEKRVRMGLSWSFPAGKAYLNLGHSLELTASLGIE